MTTIYFDTETGGVLPFQPTIQLAAIAVEEVTGRELDAFEVKIRFSESDCDPEALKMNHYDATVWAREAVHADEAVIRFSDFVHPHKCIPIVSKRTQAPYSVAKLAGYNALTFDLPRLKALYGQKFFPCSFMVRDVMQRAMFFFDEHPERVRPENLKLSTVCAYFGIATEGAHGALDDARMAAALARRLRVGVEAQAA